MSIANDNFYHLIESRIAELHQISVSGFVQEPGYSQVRNRAALILALEYVLDAHRQKFATYWNPLHGRAALHHLLLQKYKWPLEQIRSLDLQDSIFLLQEELALDALPEEAKESIQFFAGGARPNSHFSEIREEEWDSSLSGKVSLKRRIPGF